MSNPTETHTLSDYIKGLREELGISQAELAEKIGVTRLTITRWESAGSVPTPLAAEKLLAISEGMDVQSGLTKYFRGARDLEHGQVRKLQFRNRSWDIVPAPYVINGPEDQGHFHDTLINIQATQSRDLFEGAYKKRLSIIDYVDGVRTAQSVLENRNPKSKSWSSNYGPHGWHRYVGRFPSHLVRALINHFGAGPDDLILDPFAGSGTTLVESRMLGVPSIGIEICSLSCLIARTKSAFPHNAGVLIREVVVELEQYYSKYWQEFTNKHGESYSHDSIVSEYGNLIAPFPNMEKWFTPTALLGTAITIRFAETKEGFIKDAIIVALSSKMRSIGNVDVDVIRAEYSKKPRENVDVLRLVKRQLLRMANDIDATISSHSDIIAPEASAKIIEGSVLDADINKESVSYIITSPPYGVESLSYLRTHLLSYRALSHVLKKNPYDFSDKIIGSEYLAKNEKSIRELRISKISKTCADFFGSLVEQESKQNRIRINMMIHFFEDMNSVVEKFNYWLKPGGRVAFVVGNKRIAQELIPTDKIMCEIFGHNGFLLESTIDHKLKTNNSNSKVPWQDRVIDEEFVLIFKKEALR